MPDPSAPAEPQQFREVGKRDPAEDRAVEEIVAEAAKGRKVTDADQQTALEWLLTDDPTASPLAQRTVEVNVGSEDKPILLEWTLRAIDADELRRIQNKVQNPRAMQRNGGQVDEFDMHAKVVATAAIKPDVKEAAKEAALNRGQNVAPDPGSFLRDRFATKPGVLTQLAGIVMQLSGFDDSYVQEVQATGNL